MQTIGIYEIPFGLEYLKLLNNIEIVGLFYGHIIHI